MVSHSNRSRLVSVIVTGFTCIIAAQAEAGKIDVNDIDGLVKACQEARADDEIIIAPGTYTLRGRTRISIVTRPGPVTVRGADGNATSTIIEGQGQDENSVETLFELTNSPGWTFRDFTTRETFYHGFKLNGGSSGCVLRNVTMRNHGESGVKGTSDPQISVHPDRLLIENCDIGFSRAEGGPGGWWRE